MSPSPSFTATSILMLVAFFVANVAGAGPNPVDRIDEPPAQRIFLSTDGENYRLVINTVAHQAEAALQFLAPQAEPRILWTRTLPQAFGPRSVVVGAHGNVLLLDEWSRVAGEYAAMLISVSGDVLATHSFHAIVAAAGGDHVTIIRKGSLSAWMAGPPVPSDDGLSVVVPTGNTRVRISLADGSLHEET